MTKGKPKRAKRDLRKQEEAIQCVREKIERMRRKCLTLFIKNGFTQAEAEQLFDVITK